MDKNLLPSWILLLWIVVVMGLLSDWARAGSECDPVLCPAPGWTFNMKKSETVKSFKFSVQHDETLAENAVNADESN